MLARICNLYWRGFVIRAHPCVHNNYTTHGIPQGCHFINRRF